MGSPQRIHFPYSPVVDSARMVEDEWRDWLGRGWNDLRSFVQAHCSSPPTIPNSAFTTVTGWTKDIDNNTMLNPSGDFNAATGIYTAPLYGLYMAFFYANFTTAIPASAIVAAQLVSTGVPTTIQPVHAGGGATANGSDVQATGMFNLVPGQTITPKLFQNSGGNATLLANQVYFSVWQVQ